MKELTDKNVFSVEIKKSRFIAHAFPVSNVEYATSVIESARDPEARHNCWAYKIGDVYRFFDDGEPGGTAGRPILTAIEKQNFDKCLVVVIRFFGGIKLGAGGLSRAYSGVTAECLRTAPSKEIVTKVNLEFCVPFERIGDVYGLLKNNCVEKQNERFSSDGVYLLVTLDQSIEDAFTTALMEATRGIARIVSKTVFS